MSGKQVRLRRGTTAQHAMFVGAEGEVTVDTTLKTVRVHDGSTAGGFELLKRIQAEGTANGVLFLNGSKVVSSGSDLVYTATGLGIGTSSPISRTHLKQSNGTTGLTIESNINDERLLAFYNSANAEHVISATFGTTGAFRPLSFFTSDQRRLTLDPAGNLGLGGAPVVGLNFRSFQLNRAIFDGGVNDRTTLSYNYARTGGVNTYIGSDFASSYLQAGGSHLWFTAPSGTAGNPISFTQVASITNGGNLLVGTTLDNGGRIRAVGNGTIADFTNNVDANFLIKEVSGTITVGPSPAANLAFQTASTERARITSAGKFFVGQTAFVDAQIAGFRGDSSTVATIEIQNEAATGRMVTFRTNGETQVGSISFTNASVTYNTTSDYRLKTFIAKVTDAGSRLDALNPVEYEWKADGKRTRGFFAHEFQEVYADSVTGQKDAVDAEGKPVYQSMQASSSEVIADLVAEIQSLRARVAALEA